MANELTDIYADKAGSLINKLIEFLGEPNVKRSLESRERAMKSAGPIFREYYLKDRHPWLSALVQYYELTHKAKSLKRNLKPELKALAIDAHKVLTLQKSMPDSVKNKYRRDLLDVNTVPSYLFEINIAWHFSKHYDLKWCENDSGKHPEFLVKTPGFEFYVECKRISVDIARKIHRKDMYLLSDKLIPEINKRNYSGRLDIVLEDRLKSGIINKLCAKVLNVIDAGVLEGEVEIAPFGSLALDLSSVSGVVIDMNKRMKEFYKRKADEAHGAIFAMSEGGRPVDPIEFTVMSKKGDTVLDEIHEKISDAAELQLDESKPGLIACFLEEIDGFELEKLRSESGLQLMTNHVLDKNKLSHVLGIVYSSETMVKIGEGCEEIFNASLFFRSQKCKFEEAKTFKFLSPAKF